MIGIAIGNQAQRGIVRSGLVAAYHFNEGSGQVLRDRSGWNNNGQLGSVPVTDSNDPTWVTEGLNFSTDDYVSLGLPSNLNSKKVSLISCFKYVGSAGVYSHVINKTNANPGTFLLSHEIDNTICFMIRTLTVPGGSKLKIPENNNWNLISGTYDGKTQRMYQGKTKVGELTLDDEIETSNYTRLQIGARNSDLFFNGLLGFLLVYNKGLTSEEVARNYEVIKAIMAKRGVSI